MPVFLYFELLALELITHSEGQVIRLIVGVKYAVGTVTINDVNKGFNRKVSRRLPLNTRLK